MVRLEDVTAAAPVSETDLIRLLADHGYEHAAQATRPAKARLAAQWTIDLTTGRPVCHWIVLA